jgi:hypothetical protein
LYNTIFYQLNNNVNNVKLKKTIFWCIRTPFNTLWRKI